MMFNQKTHPLRMHDNYSNMYDNIQRDLLTYITEENLKSLVLGVSGGIDSALAAALAKPVCDTLGIPLIGVSIPIKTNKPEENYRAKLIMDSFCTIQMKQDLSLLYLLAKDATDIATMEHKVEESETAEKIRNGNIKARLRMIYLYNLAQYHKGMVLSTDNLTEYYLGFWTLHGDVGDYGMFQNLWKTEVYGLAKWIIGSILTTDAEKAALRLCVDAVPTDGLGITDSDLDQIGCKTYEEVDNYLYNIFFCSSPEVFNSPASKKVVTRYENSEYKRNNPYNVPRERIVWSPDFK